MRKGNWIQARIFALILIAASLSIITSACAEAPQEAQISGVLEKVEYVATAYNAPDNTVLYFKDGRVKSFRGMSTAVFQKDKINTVTYDSLKQTITKNVISESATNAETKP